MAAIWLSVILLGISFVLMIMAVLSTGDYAGEIEDGSILYIDLTGFIDERYTPPTVEDMIMGTDNSGERLDEILQSLDLAAGDERISGVYINTAGAASGLATFEEIAQAIEKYRRESGRQVWAYSDTYTQGDYLVASACDRVVLNPAGGVEMGGMVASVPYFKNALDKLGVEMQVFKVGTFKNAVEPFLLDSMSQPSREMYANILDNSWDTYSAAVARNRSVEQSAVTQWADSLLMAYTPRELCSMGVIDAVQYRHEFEKEMALKWELTDPDADLDDYDLQPELPLVTPGQYMAEMRDEKGIVSDESHIAVVYAVGEIVDTGDYGIAGDRYAAMILKLADDENVAGLLLRVNSGGGSAFASEQIWEALEYFKRKGKPFYVSMGDYAASGGYYISCGADRIYADKGTLTGSIGIFGMVPCAKELLNDKLGVNMDYVETSPNAVLGSIGRPLNDYQSRVMQAHVERGYKLFTQRVADGRDMPLDSVLAIAEGRVWTGASALELGLVDQCDGIMTALADLAHKAGVDPGHYVAYPRIDISALELIMQTIDHDLVDPTAYPGYSTGATLADVTGLEPEELRKLQQTVQRVRDMGTVQARMEDITIR